MIYREELRFMHHVDWEMLLAALGGEVPVKTLLRQMLRHLEELCPECAETLAAVRGAVERGGGGSAAERAAISDVLQALSGGKHPMHPSNGTAPADPRYVGVFDGAFDRASESARSWASQVRRERRRARADLAELLRTPAAHRRQRIERAQTRFRTRAVAELLLEESRRLVREQPAEARSLAELVEPVLLWMPGAVGQDWARDLAVRAQAWVANTFRIEYELRAAERQFAEVRARMAREVVSESVHAEVASLEASLRLYQGRTEDAARLLEGAAALCRVMGDRGRLARVLVQQALVADRCGDQAQAAAVQREALELLRAEGDEQLVRESLINLGFYLVDGDQVSEAEEVVAAHESLLRQADMWDWPHMRILRGRIALSRGREDDAEELFLAARAELIQKGDPVRAAVASLDLAVLYLAQGKTADLRRMARLMGSIFEAAELESEALAAVALFQQAVEAESVTEAAIRCWRRQLEVGRPVRRERVEG